MVLTVITDTFWWQQGARQLQSGAPPLVSTHSSKPSRIAQEEINAGKVKHVVPGQRTPAFPSAESA